MFLGCDDAQEWFDGLHAIWADKGFASKYWFVAPVILTTTGGRKDMAFRFRSNATIAMEQLALWKLSFGGCSWIPDYRLNYADQHDDSAIQNEDEDAARALAAQKKAIALSQISGKAKRRIGTRELNALGIKVLSI